MCRIDAAVNPGLGVKPRHFWKIAPAGLVALSESKYVIIWRIGAPHLATIGQRTR